MNDPHLNLPPNPGQDAPDADSPTTDQSLLAGTGSDQWGQLDADAYLPPQSMPAQPAANDDPVVPPSPATAPDSKESLEAQNIFELLGVTEGGEDEREAFLDELQQVIWEDFIDNDVELLITSQEQEQLQAIRSQRHDSSEAEQEAILVFLEKLIPDLEEIMLEKALELKEDLARERVATVRQYFQDDPTKLDQVSQAENEFNSGNWAKGAQLLNQIS